VGIDGESRDQTAFDERMRIVFHQHAVFAGAGLAFVGIDDDVLGLGRSARDETPLHAGGEAGAAAAAQVGSFDLVDDLGRGHLRSFEKGLVAVGRKIGVDGGGVLHTEASGEDAGFERAGRVIKHGE
jgi:hypothetical protein